MLVPRVGVGRSNISRIVGRVVIEQRNMAECHKEWCRSDFLALQSIFQPGNLGLTVRLALEQESVPGIGVQFVLRGVQSDKRDVSHPHCEIAAEVPVPGRPLLRLAEHPDVLQMPVRHPPVVVVARTEQVRQVGSVILPVDLRLYEYPYLPVDGLFDIGSISVPDHAGWRDRGYLVPGPLDGVPVDVGVVDYAEMSLGILARGSEAVDPRILLIAGDLDLVPGYVVNAVCSDPVIVFRGGFQPCQAHLDDLVVDFRHPESTALNLDGVAQVRLLPDEDISVGQGTDPECDSHRCLCVVLEHRVRYDQLRTGLFRILFDIRLSGAFLQLIGCLQCVRGTCRCNQYRGALYEIPSFHILGILIINGSACGCRFRMQGTSAGRGGASR